MCCNDISGGSVNKTKGKSGKYSRRRDEPDDDAMLSSPFGSSDSMSYRNDLRMSDSKPLDEEQF